MASKHVDLIKVVIPYVIVRKNDNTQLKSMEIVYLAENPIHRVMIAYLTGIGSITTPSKDSQENVENTQDNHSDVDRFVFVKISVGEDILPVHWHWQG